MAPFVSKSDPRPELSRPASSCSKEDLPACINEVSECLKWTNPEAYSAGTHNDRNLAGEETNRGSAMSARLPGFWTHLASGKERVDLSKNDFADWRSSFKKPAAPNSQLKSFDGDIDAVLQLLTAVGGTDARLLVQWRRIRRGG